ncbi:secretin N-terminal domain-containing protein [Methylocucumis oryzae]|uniref:secretin N-terminal domain-containing protein n=1 Tax=Methylocucumis oryzae TaxID=1632867 RepID=UPI001EF9F751|nr:secretin N-terminal domain-containing protein [Methylocucumis oryzae]
MPAKRLNKKSNCIRVTSVFVPTAPSHKQTSNEKGTYNLNFDDADLGEVAKAVLSDILGLNYVLSPKVAGKVTLNTTQPLTKDELLPTLEMVLRMNNAALVKDGKIYHIEPAADALYTSEISTGSSAPGYQTRVIPIKNVSVTDLVELIKPLVQEKTILQVDGTRNILIASGTPDEMARVMDMVSTFDIDVLKGRSFGLFPLTHTEPETIIKELEEVFSSKGGKDDENEFFRFIPIERMNAIMAITHQTRYLHDIENWIARLDKANTGGGGVNVYKVQHADAEELADTLNEIFTGAAPSDKSAKVAAGKKASEISNKPAGDSNSSSDTKSSSSSSSSSLSSKRSSRSRSSSSRSSGGTATVANIEDVKIISDKANNALIIVATPREYDIILPVIKQLDIFAAASINRSQDCLSRLKR